MLDGRAAAEALSRMGRSLRQLSRVPATASRAASDGIRELLDEQFANGTDPYGNPWEPLAESTVKRKGGDERVLIRTEAMRRGLDVRPSPGAGVTITLEEYGSFHQVGTKYMPQRTILPDNRGLPDTWQRAIADALDEAFTRWGEAAT